MHAHLRLLSVLLGLFVGTWTPVVASAQQQSSQSPPARTAVPTIANRRLPPITVVPLVFTMPAPEYDVLKHWGLEQWSVQEVKQLFAAMQRDGVTLVVLPSAVGNATLYPSKILPNRLDYDAYDRLFRLAQRHGMQVAMSGILYTYHRQFQGKSWDAQADLEMNKRICTELYERYGRRPNFWGWYIPHETGDRVHRGDVMTILRHLPPFLKKLTPDKKVAFSPWFTSRVTLGDEATTPQAFAAEWDQMLQDIHGIDVFAIQDSTAPEDEIGTWFAAAAPVFRKHGAELWSVVELFSRGQDVVRTDMSRAIPFARVLKKMQAAAPYVSRFACWEYQNYLNPQSPVPGAAKLSRDYRAYFKIDRRNKR